MPPAPPPAHAPPAPPQQREQQPTYQQPAQNEHEGDGQTEQPAPEPEQQAADASYEQPQAESEYPGEPQQEPSAEESDEAIPELAPEQDKAAKKQQIKAARNTIDEYLKALGDQGAAPRGGKAAAGSADNLQKRLEKAQREADKHKQDMDDAVGIAKLEASAKKQAADKRVASLEEKADRLSSFQDLEDSFVEVAFLYAQEKRIGYETWREAGVPAAVLKRSGITLKQKL